MSKFSAEVDKKEVFAVDAFPELGLKTKIAIQEWARLGQREVHVEFDGKDKDRLFVTADANTVKALQQDLGKKELFFAVRTKEDLDEIKALLRDEPAKPGASPLEPAKPKTP